jgi:hypothetical protein
MFGSQWFANPGVTYEIENSCRFNDNDSAFTGAASPTPTSERIFTFSFWIKRANLGTDQTIWSNERDDADNTYGQIKFQANDTLRWKAENTGGANLFDRQTNAAFRDPSAWYHVVCVVDSNQTDSTGADIYVNGVVQTYSATTNFGSAQDLAWPSTAKAFEVGKLFNDTHYLDAYLANFYFIDGQKLTPSDFGETNSTTGQWVPIEYSGTFGNAGLFLEFSVASGTGAGAGTDSSGNDNDLTDSGLAAADQMPDTPTDNYCTFNPLDRRIVTFDYTVTSNGNLDVTQSSTTGISMIGTTIPAASGKWYWETTVGSSGYIHVGILATAKSLSDGSLQMPGANTQGWVYRYDGKKENGATMTSYGDTFTAGDVISVAWDADIGAIWFAKDGTWQASATEAEIEAGTTTNAAFSSGIAGIECRPIVAEDQGDYTNSWVGNFGQHSFTGSMPSGFSHLSTANLSDPTIADPSAYFQPTIYTGDGASSLAVNQGGNSTFDPDFVWIKNRDATDGHCLFDSVRGATELLASDSTAAEVTDADTLLSFDSDGFSVGADVKVNTNTEKYVGWQWLESATAGFDIVSFTGNATARTISHSLGVVPEVIIVKNLADTDNWAVYHASNTTAPATDYLILNTTAATADDATIWNDTVPTSSVFSVGTSSLTNGNTEAMIAYLFAGVEGFSKFGGYVGTGNADGPFIWCGFRPAFIMTKRAADGTNNWIIQDAIRQTYNGVCAWLYPNLTNVESAGTTNTDILSNGFKIKNTDGEFNAAVAYVYMAFAETPFKTATAR